MRATLIAETLFFDYYRQHGTAIKVARIFNTYGPRMHPHDGRVISNFVMQALRSQPVTIYGDGTQTRSFCYVDDMIDAFIKFMASPDTVVGPLNLGNPVEYSIHEIASTIIEMTNSRSEIVFEKLPADDPRQRKPDISQATRVLDWSPSTPLRDGLSRTIAYFEGELGKLT